MVHANFLLLNPRFFIGYRWTAKNCSFRNDTFCRALVYECKYECEYHHSFYLKIPFHAKIAPINRSRIFNFSTYIQVQLYCMFFSLHLGTLCNVAPWIQSHIILCICNVMNIGPMYCPAFLYSQCSSRCCGSSNTNNIYFIFIRLK